MALIALLYNVQFHACAHEVTIHADAEGPSWEVSVADDGIGFDSAHTAYGFGLRRQVIEPLESEGLHVTIQSHRGEGTIVTVTNRHSD